MTLVVGASCIEYRWFMIPTAVPEAFPLQEVIDVDWAALEAVSATLKGKRGNTKLLQPKDSLAFPAWVFACLGGWTGCYEESGPFVMLNDLYQFPATKR